MFKKKKLSAILFLTALSLSFILAQSVQASSIFNRDLKVGNTNSDVAELQKFLNTNGFTIAKNGSGSLGHETIYFGTATKNALAKFQKANKIVPATGYFGLITRNIVNKKSAGSVIKNNIISGAVTNTVINSKTDTKIDIPTNNQPSSYYSVSGSVVGIVGAITIKNNGGDNVILKPGDNSEFIFPTKLANGTNYAVSVKSNSVSQNCYIKNATGTVEAINVSDIKIACGGSLFYNPFTFIPSGGVSRVISSYILTYAAGSGGSITGATSQTISRGNSGAAVTAVADTSYHFVNWSDGSTANPRTDTNITENVVVSANFVRNPAPTITSISPDSGPVAGGTTLTIIGTNFSNIGGTPDVSFGGQLVLATYVASTSLTVVTPANTAGTVDVIVSNPDGQSVSKVNGFTYLSIPTSITLTSGNLQTAVVNSIFSAPLVVIVTDSFENPVSGVTVTFTAPSSGASGVFASSMTNSVTVITDISGLATAPIFSANSLAGHYSVVATSGALTPVFFNLTNQDAI